MSTSSRIVGLDMARSLAIIGMIILHMASLVWSTKVILSGLPAALFAIIAGVTMMLIGKNYSMQTLLRLIARGAIITHAPIAMRERGSRAQMR